MNSIKLLAAINKNAIPVFFLSICILQSCKKEIKSTVAEAAVSSSSAGDHSKPNIIFILGDDVGFEVPTVNGGESYTTTNFDALAQEGMRFTNCFASPLSSPSRFMLLTGKYNFRNYIQWGIMDTTNNTIADMLRDDGYNTCYAGKWQLGGGGPSIKALGFNKYSAWNITSTDGSLDMESPTAGNRSGSQYKNPKIFQDGKYLPQSFTNGKYGDDIWTNYVNDFIDSNKQQPFFVMYAMGLCHSPFCPTPDDPEFAGWDPDLGISQKKFFPSMVKYMDKKAGQIIAKVKSLGLENNTIIIWNTGDNGTANGIPSRFNGVMIQGQKGHLNNWGTHVPLIVYAPGKIAGGTVNDDLIDFTDYMPTMADMAGIPAPSTYGTLDGVSFYSRLTGQGGTPRDWIFCQFSPQFPVINPPIIRWVQNKNYKLYDSTVSYPSNKFYNVVTDIYEKRAIAPGNMTLQEMQIKASFEAVAETMH